MAIGKFPPLAHLHPTPLTANTVLWHEHPQRYPATAFNPVAVSRFAQSAAVFAQPSHSMFYAGETPPCALWETSLRDVVGDVDGIVVLHATQFRGAQRVRQTSATPNGEERTNDER